MAGLIPFNRNRGSLMNIDLDDFSHMIDDFFTGNSPMQRSLARDTFKIDIQDSDKEYTIEAELPGVKKEDIDITIHDGRLNLSVKKEESIEEENKNYIHRERRSSQMARSILLTDAEDEGIQAKLEDGVLTVTVPKKEEKDTSKRIMIE